MAAGGYVTRVDPTTSKTLDQQANGTVRDFSSVPFPFEMSITGIRGFIISKAESAFLCGRMYDYLGGYDLKTGKEIGAVGCRRVDRQLRRHARE